MKDDDNEIFRDEAKYKIQVYEERHAIKFHLKLQVEGIKTEL